MVAPVGAGPVEVTAPKDSPAAAWLAGLPLDCHVELRANGKTLHLRRVGGFAMPAFVRVMLAVSPRG